MFITTKNYIYIYIFFIYLFFFDYECSLLESDVQASFSSFFSAPDCWCFFTGIVVHQLWSSAFSRKHEVWAPVAVAGMAHHVFFFFFFFLLSNWDGAPPELGALCKQHTLHISIVRIAQTGPQGHFSVGPQRGRGSSPPPPCARHWLISLKFSFVF